MRQKPKDLAGPDARKKHGKQNAKGGSLSRMTCNAFFDSKAKQVYYKIMLYSDLQMSSAGKCAMEGIVWEYEDRKEYRASLIGGAMAARQNLFYGDNHEPTRCEKTALELFRECRKATLDKKQFRVYMAEA